MAINQYPPATLQNRVQYITTTGTFTLPPGYDANRPFVCDVIIYGGGGGGGGGTRGTLIQMGGGGGGGSGFGFRYENVVLTTNVSAVIGAGGTGGAGNATPPTPGSPGAQGGTSSFASQYFALGGAGGTGGGRNTQFGSGGTQFLTNISDINVFGLYWQQNFTGSSAHGQGGGGGSAGGSGSVLATTTTTWNVIGGGGTNGWNAINRADQGSFPQGTRSVRALNTSLNPDVTDMIAGVFQYGGGGAGGSAYCYNTATTQASEGGKGGGLVGGRTGRGVEDSAPMFTNFGPTGENALTIVAGGGGGGSGNTITGNGGNGGRGEIVIFWREDR